MLNFDRHPSALHGDEYAESTISSGSTVTGVAQVQAFGGAKYAVRVDGDPRRLSARVSGWMSRDRHSGRERHLPPEQYTAEELHGLAEGMYRARRTPAVTHTVTAIPCGLATSPASTTARAGQGRKWYGNLRNITLVIFKHRARMSSAWSTRSGSCCLRSASAAAVGFARVRTDRSASIRESVHDVKLTLWLTFGLVVVVIFIFLRNLTATIIRA